VLYTEKENNERRSFLKYLLSFIAFALPFFFSFKKEEGFKIGKFKVNSLGPSEASGVCGYGMGCAGGGGQCGYGMNCAGGGGVCGYGMNCAGGQGDPSPDRRNAPFGGGQCGYGMGCAGGGGVCGYGMGCAGN
jgi:hypothetical protein